MTKRQEEAKEWLESVGKSTEKLARKHGFAPRTFHALADAGHIRRDYMPRQSMPFTHFPVFRPLEDEPKT